MHLPHFLDPRRSFGAKLVAALLVTVGLMLAVMLLVVRRETAGQVELVTARAVERAQRAFEESEARRVEQLALRATSFTGGRRGQALVEEAIAAGDTAFLEAESAYRLALLQFGEQDNLTVLTDAGGAPVLTLLGGQALPGADPAGVRPLVVEMLDTYAPDLFAYRLVGGVLYTVLVDPLDIGGPPVGFIAFGLSIADADAEALGRIAGGDVCLTAGGACVAGSEAARGRLDRMLEELPAGAERVVVTDSEDRWAVVAQPLMAERPDDGRMVMAVPLNAVLSPFDRIRRALAWASAAALALAAVISVFLARGLTHPVRELVGATQRVARGDYEARVHEDSEDEIGQLARSFNAMTEGLALKEQYRGVLDKVVSKEVAEELLRGDLRLGGENREVTVLFADVRGFTTLTEGMEPQEVIGLLNDVMERLSNAVEDAGGVVDKYVGDEIMAVFGAPLSQLDHARRAVAAAASMQAAMAEVNESRARRGAPPVRIGVGINTGIAVAGNMGSSNRLNYTVLGETVNLAARLCAAAGPGQVLLTDATRDRIDGFARTTGGGTLDLKGFSRGIPVHELVLRDRAAAASRG